MFKSYKLVSLFLAVAFLLGFGGLSSFINVAYAASLLNKSDTMSSSKDNTASNHTIVFRTPTGAAELTDTITIEFDKGAGTAFTTPGSLDYTDLDLAHSAGAQANCTSPTYTNDEVLAATATASDWGVGVVTGTDTITLTPPTDGVGVAAIAANACVRVKIGTHASTGTTGDQQITNPDITVAASYIIAVAGVIGDSGDVAVQIIPDDQVSVTAAVTESISFSISDVSIGFGTLDSANARYATGDALGSASEVESHNIIVGTNAANGYTLTATGTTLTFSTYSINAIGPSNTASAVGTEQFGLRANSSGGSGTVSAPYLAAGFAFDTAAFPDELASSAGTSANTTYSLRYLANIAPNTEAGSYSATLTYAATANF
ncbi:MAG: hypothetical protein WC705_00580 [Candidatus Paceibacterota bacterium]|jgi:hypothetical protein